LVLASATIKARFVFTGVKDLVAASMTLGYGQEVSFVTVLLK
jgi:hypothetical protein